MAYRPRQIANYFIQKSLMENRKITPMKAIKLTYIAHGWSLALYNQPLIQEAVHAWKYGPVIDSLYHDLKQYGNQSIEKPIKQLYLQRGKVVSETPTVPLEDTQTRALLDKVWEIYGQYTGIQLSSMTHAEGTPWSITVEHYVKHGYLPDGLSIPDEVIKRHFKDKVPD